MSDDAPAALGPIATRILFEDDAVVIWEQRLEPGEATAPHLHERDDLLVDVAGDKLRVEPAHGHDNPHFQASFELPTERGRALLVTRGSVEVAVNTGARPYRGILVELKD